MICALGQNSTSDAITQGMAIAHGVTPTDTSAAVSLIGEGAGIFTCKGLATRRIAPHVELH